MPFPAALEWWMLKAMAEFQQKKFDAARPYARAALRSIDSEPGLHTNRAILSPVGDIAIDYGFMLLASSARSDRYWTQRLLPRAEKKRRAVKHRKACWSFVEPSRTTQNLLVPTTDMFAI